MKRLFLLAGCLLLVAWGCESPEAGEDIEQQGSSDEAIAVAAGPAESAAAAQTREKLQKRGLVDGQDWSIDLEFADARVGSVLDFLAKLARHEPREIDILVDRRAIDEEGVGLESPISISARGLSLGHLSLGEALDRVLGDRLGYTVLKDGTVLVSVPRRLKAGPGSFEAALRPILVRPTKEAALTLKKLAVKGPFLGEDWSIPLEFSGAPLSSVLDFICELARAKPREVNIITDHAGIREAGVDLDQLISLSPRGVSLQEALALILPDELGYLILDDGTVVITARRALSRFAAHSGPFVARRTPQAVRMCGVVLGAVSAQGRPTTFNLHLDDASVSAALRSIIEQGRAADPPMNIVIDRQAVQRSGANLEQCLTVHCDGVSLACALGLVLPVELAFAVLEDGQVRISTPEALLPPAVLATHQKLRRKGLIGNEMWSISLEFTDAPPSTVLEFIGEVAPAKPRQIAICVDGEGIRNVDLDMRCTVQAKDVSIQEALTLVLGKELAYAILGDGSVIISTTGRIAELAAKGEVFPGG